ncbi:MAG TPA: hypothetical protein VHT74_03680 [Acetobacteraceae bacterium]|jgi:hypothetical protein|nr:hypothetical protein [Acetobacteraceae bacterium]
MTDNVRTRKKRMPPNGEAGAPPIEIDLAMVERLASIQCTDAEIAAVLGVSVDTLWRRKRDDPEFVEFLERGKGKGRATLRRLQWQQAQKGNATMLVWLGKQTLGQTDKAEITGKDGAPVTFVIRAPTPLESADEWLNLHAPKSLNGEAVKSNGRLINHDESQNGE